MMSVVAVVCSVMLGVTGVPCLVRIVRGPTMLDRTVATDVFVAVSLAAVGLVAAVGRHTATVPVLLALALVGFLGSVSIARFAARDSGAAQESIPDTGPGNGAETAHAARTSDDADAPFDEPTGDDTQEGSR